MHSISPASKLSEIWSSGRNSAEKKERFRFLRRYRQGACSGQLLNMEEQSKPPYLRTIGRRGRITIWVVDGAYVRTHLEKEFTNYGQHYAFECIPEDEFWLDDE